MKLKKLDKVNESFTVNRYDNGFMIEVSDLLAVIKEALSLTVAY